jgi:hypothetical protein
MTVERYDPIIQLKHELVKARIQNKRCPNCYHILTDLTVLETAYYYKKYSHYCGYFLHVSIIDQQGQSKIVVRETNDSIAWIPLEEWEQLMGDYKSEQEQQR